MQQMFFKYLIVYQFEKDGRFGFGRCNLKRDEELNDFESIVQLENNIKEEQGFDNIILLNWKKLKS